MNDPQTASPAVTRRIARRRRISPAVLALVLLALLTLLFITLFGAYQFTYGDRVIPGVSVMGQSMNGLARAEAKEFLQKKYGNPDAILARFGGEAALVRDGNHTWRAYPWELGLRTDFNAVAESAVLLGHRGSLIERGVEQVRCLWFGCDLGSDAQFDEATARAYLSWLAPQVEQPARDAALRIEGVRVIALPAQSGRSLDGETTMARMRQRILGMEHGEVNIAVRETPPLLTDAGIATAKAQAEALLAAPILLSFGERTWTLDQATLATLVTFRTRSVDGTWTLAVSLDQAQLTAYLKTLAREINQPARDARFRFEPTTGALTLTLPSQHGYALDVDAAVKQVEQAALGGTTRAPGNALAARALNLPVTDTKPAVAMEDAAKFGIKELVAQGVSNFKGSSAGRIQNVRTATAQFEGVVVPPGATFSFNQYLGDVVEANGFDDAYIIFADRTVLGPGGGVCQVSSTIFRAAFFGGFPIVERWAHAYRVGYYEPPVGLDATVFSPTVDFKFKNDTDAYLLIQPKLDLKATTLTFNLYGTKPNRTVEMEEPILERVIVHGPAIYTDDPTLKKGVTKQIDFAHDGADVTVWRKILVNGQVVKREKFFSRYEPWVARYLVGTKVVK